MKLLGAEHYELMAAFERSMFGARSRKEPKEFWSMGRIYQHGETNELFRAFRLGYEFGRKRGDA